MVHGPDRDATIDRLRRALDETEIGGIQTTLPFDRFVARSASFRDADLSTGWVDEHWDGEAARRDAVDRALLAAGLAAAAHGDQRTPPTQPLTAVIPGTGADGWRRDGRERGVDRWPR
jgi:acetyl/propionyl-CoA carboxylase alpha subunit